MPPKQQANIPQDMTQESLEKNQANPNEIPNLLAQNNEIRAELNAAAQELSQDSHEEEPASEETPEQVPNAENPPSEEEIPSDNAPENAPSPSEETEHQDMIPQEEENLAAEEKLQNMRLSAFGQMVIQSKDLPQSVQKTFRQKATGFVGDHSELISAVANTGLAAKSVYDTGKAGGLLQNYDTEKDKLKPDGKKTKVLDFITSLASSSILIALSAVKMYKTFSASDDSTGIKTAKSLPSLFKILAVGSDIIASSFEHYQAATMTTKSILNFSASFKSLMDIIQSSIEFYALNKRLKRISSLKQDSQSKLGIVKKDLEAKKKSFFINIPALSTKFIAELSYAIAYLKNPSSKATFITNLATKGTSALSSGVSALTSNSSKELSGPDMAHQNLASEEYEAFTKLYTEPKLFIGDHETPNDLTSVEDKNKAFDAYKDFHKELKVLGLSVKELSEASCKDEQKELIKKAVGF